jgi:hypothetical protein
MKKPPVPTKPLCRPAPILALLLAAITSSCSSPRPLHGGRASTIPTGPSTIAQTLAQSDNPSSASRQDQETIRTRTYTLPAGTRIEQQALETAPPTPAGTSPTSPHSSHSSYPSHSVPITPTLHYPTTPPVSIILSAPTPVVERSETRARTELGAAQKDTARELAAKLSSLKAIVWVGVGLFLFGLASLFWPPLRAIIASLTTSIAITLGGIALMILPTLIVGNELLILAGVALAVGGWFLAHRHGHLRGQLIAAESKPEIRVIRAIRGQSPAPPK